MKKIVLILLVLISFKTIAQLPYTWTSGVNPSWVSSNPTNNTLSFQSGCWNTVSTSNCISPTSWNTYNNSQRTSYTSPTYNFSSCATNVNVAFQLDINLENTYDWLYFQYSIDGGTTWINPVALSTVNNNSNVNMSAYSPLTTACTGCNRRGWTGGLGTVNLSYNIGVTATTRFRFIFESDGSVNSYAGGTAIYYADIISFSVTCPSPLPIELLSFTSDKLTCGNNIIRWSTATETNNDYFVVERSLDMVTFTNIGTVDGAGNSTTILNYNFKDITPQPALNYYRLKQIDFNGDASYSTIVSVDNTCLTSLKVIKILNLLGQEVNTDFDGPRFIFYSDGTIIKRVGN